MVVATHRLEGVEAVATHREEGVEAVATRRLEGAATPRLEGAAAPHMDMDFADFARAVSTLTVQAVTMTDAVTRLVDSFERRFSRLESSLDAFEGELARAVAPVSDTWHGEGGASSGLGGDAEAAEVDAAATGPSRRYRPSRRCHRNRKRIVQHNTRSNMVGEYPEGWQ